MPLEQAAPCCERRVRSSARRRICRRYARRTRCRPARCAIRRAPRAGTGRSPRRSPRRTPCRRGRPSSSSARRMYMQKPTPVGRSGYVGTAASRDARRAPAPGSAPGRPRIVLAKARKRTDLRVVRERRDGPDARIGRRAMHDRVEPAGGHDRVGVEQDDIRARQLHSAVCRTGEAQVLRIAQQHDLRMRALLELARNSRQCADPATRHRSTPAARRARRCASTLSTHARTSSGALYTGTTMSITNDAGCAVMRCQRPPIGFPPQPDAQPRQRQPPASALPIRDDPLLRGQRAFEAVRPRREARRLPVVRTRAPAALRRSLRPRRARLSTAHVRRSAP